MSVQLEILLIAVITSLACALPGVLLVLRRMALMSDAISHAILPGIVLMFFVTHDLESPWLMAGAAAMGLLNVWLTELLQKTGLVKEDAAIGLVFPVLFSIGVLLVARYAGNIHLDVDSVLLGELAFAPLDRLILGGVDFGPVSLYQMTGIFLINLTFLTLFYKEIKIVTFDPELAAFLGFMPVFVHYMIMAFISITAVGAFDVVGSILVVALMIAPGSAALLITERMGRVLIATSLFAVLSAIAGYGASHLLEVSIAGSIAVMSGIVFLLTLLFSPSRGLWAAHRRRQRQKGQFARDLLLVHLLNHQGMPEASTECLESHLTEHIAWTKLFAAEVVHQAIDRKLIHREGDMLFLTQTGREQAAAVMER